MTSPKTKGRMINKDISNSKKFAQLSPPAAVLFCMMIPHYNAHGKMNGDPGYLKGEVCPRIPYLTIKNIPVYLKEINDTTNVKWFEFEERYWIHSTNFLTEHQTLDLKKIGQDKLPNYSGVIPELVHPEVEVEVEVEVEGRAAPGIPISEIIEYLNDKAGTNYSPKTKQTVKHLTARWERWPDIAKFKAVVDNMVSRWKYDEKMSQYLCPNTLFGSEEKMEKYLNSKSSEEQQAVDCIGRPI